jgi:release factor glutamine methyltransferase
VQFSLSNKTFLELGAGSGLISIFAAKQHANVTATDINSVAVEYLEKNAAANNVGINIIQSDLFKNIPFQQFDIIAINPPYYKKRPLTHKEYAWYCGEHGEYFENLFSSLSNYIHGQSIIIIILCDGCDLQMIHAIANKNNFKLNCVYNKPNLLERNFIFKVEISGKPIKA